MIFRTLKFIPERDILALRSRAETVLAAWVKRWFAEEVMIELLNVSTLDHCIVPSVASQVWRLDETDGRWGALSVTQGIDSLLHVNQADRGDLMSGPVGEGLVLTFIGDLLHHVVSGVPTDMSEVPGNLVRCDGWPSEIGMYASGAVLLAGQINGVDWQLVVSHACVQGEAVDHATQSTSLSSISEHLGHLDTKLCMSLPTQALSLEDLMTLEVGNVLALEQKINTPIRVLSACGDGGVIGFMGQKDGKRAIYVQGKAAS